MAASGCRTHVVKHQHRSLNGTKTTFPVTQKRLNHLTPKNRISRFEQKRNIWKKWVKTSQRIEWNLGCDSNRAILNRCESVRFDPLRTVHRESGHLSSWEFLDTTILNLKMLLSRNFVVFAQAPFRKILAPIKIKSALPPPPPPPKPPLKRGILWTWVFLAERTHFFPGVHKIGAAVSGPRIADKKFTDTRIFLILAIPQWTFPSVVGLPYSLCPWLSWFKAEKGT